MAKQPVIAVVDDDQNILTSVSIALESEGFETKTFTNGEDALKAIGQSALDLAVLDIKMPRMDGMELLARLRRESQLPVIFLTSKDDELDEILGLKMGADDYITKPFSVRLLIERVRAVLRRAELARADDESGEAPREVIERGPLILDPERHLCTWRDEPVSLTVTEFLILQALASRPGHVKTRDQLMDAAYSDDVYVDDRTIDSHIKRMRKKFRDVDGGFAQIDTLYGIGYRFRES